MFCLFVCWLVFLQMRSPVRGSFRLSSSPSDASGGFIFFSLFTRKVRSLFVCATFCVHSCACVAYPCGSVAVGLCARIRRRTTAPTPPPGARSRPFARILPRSHCKPSREDEEEKSYYWPMETQTLFLYTHVAVLGPSGTV